MYKKTITFTDYNGNKQTRDYYFNLNKAELIEMQLSHPDGFEGWIKRVIDADDRPTLLKLFKDLILNSYGEKDETGLRFIKSPELSQAFMQTEAFAELYTELATDADAATMFVNGLVPKIESSDKPVV